MVQSLKISSGQAAVKAPDGGRDNAALWLAACGLAGFAAALWLKVRRWESAAPPIGRFIIVDGVRLHYLERGSGPPVVLLHGNGAMAQDFVLSGIVGQLAVRHRVIVFDRPGFGYSERPRTRLWTPDAQAELILKALAALGIEQAIVVGHSWGCMVAAAMGLQAPDRVVGLVLAGGYLFPTVRADAWSLTLPAIPLAGDILRWTIMPALCRPFLPFLLRKIFEPAPVPDHFHAFPVDLALRPSQLRATAAENALLVPGAAALSGRYSALRQPVAIIAGAGDALVSPLRHSARLHSLLPNSRLHMIPGAGHMVHHTAPSIIVTEVQEITRSLG